MSQAVRKRDSRGMIHKHEQRDTTAHNREGASSHQAKATFLTLQSALSKPGAFWLYGLMAVGGAVWVGVSMPETAGRSLEQIERVFERRSTRVI